ncbi:MAG: ROK family transcriptional regulator [Dinoroseobacter sp.]|nr:ROK family transcriptional regulator [Dinoroseobacter sp.]
MPATTTDEEDARPRASGVRGTNQSGMRARNERLVLSLVRQHYALAKAEIARMTGLSAQTVSVIMRELESEGLLLRGEPLRGRVGQPSIPMRLNPEGAYFLGLKVGRRSAELVLTDFLGAVISRERRTYDYPRPDETLAFAKDSIGRLTEGMPRAHRSRIAGMGIAMPFFLWDWAQTLQVPPEAMAAWRTADLKGSLEKEHDFPIFLQNDATAACGAELVFGPQDGPRDFLYFYVGFFIGGGVVLNGRIFSGRGNSGALGPLPIPGRTGKIGSLIDVASLYLLERKVVKSGQTANAIWEDPELWDIPEELLRDWIAEAASGIAHAIKASCSLIDFECAKIDGWMPAPVLLRLISEVERCLSELDMTGLECPTVVQGAIGPDARALGAASLPLSGRYLVDSE